jgi:hypothetical protein
MQALAEGDEGCILHRTPGGLVWRKERITDIRQSG